MCACAKNRESESERELERAKESERERERAKESERNGAFRFQLLRFGAPCGAKKHKKALETAMIRE